ncbi:MAG: hypothetical protein ACXVP0_09415 [Bacteroidia bacterium]
MLKRIIIFIVFFIVSTAKSQTDTLTKLLNAADSLAVDNEKADSTRLGNSFNIPIFSTAGGDDGDLEQQDVSALLQSSRDLFTRYASFQFGSARYRMRGYMAENQMVMINGVNVNNLETGYSSWSNWGGLNDVTRFVENRYGVVASQLNFTGAGGYTNIDSRASSFRKGTRVSYASANRIFQNRGMITHSTGMMKNGWAVTLSASFRQGDAQNAPKLYAPGTYFNAFSFYAAVDKRLNDRNLLSFTGFYSPIEQGRSQAETMEAYQIAGSNYYNGLWGYQNGKVRNSSVSKTKRPMFMLSHIHEADKDTKLTTTVYYTFGKSSLSALNWNNAPNPHPDYYRYFPSYSTTSGDTAGGNAVAGNWANNVNTRQINWDQLIAMNQANLYSLPGQGGPPNTTETRARYIVEDRVEDMKNVGFNSVLNKRKGNFFISAGLNGNIYRNRKYKIMDDLLGATFWLDVDQFAENLGVDDSFKQNDISNPNRKVYKGDKFGYDYSINENRGEGWAQAEYNMKALDVYAGFTLSDNVIWREGFLANGKFPTTSKGVSQKVNFFNYGFKGGLTYKLSGRQYITANGLYQLRPPEASNTFIAPRVRNDVVTGIKDERVLSTDVNYILHYPGFKARLTYYYAQFNNQTWVRTFWSDLYNNNVDLIMRGVNQTHQGIEVAVDKTLFTVHSLQGVFGYGQYVYTNQPKLSAYQDNNNVSLYTDRTVYLNNYKVGGTPQMVLGLGYKYTGKKYWFAGVNFNYFDQIYVEPNPDRRTAESIGKYVDTESNSYNPITKQEKLPGYFIVNLNAGKSFRIAKKYFMNFNFSINNLLNNQKTRTGGYEQLRWDYSNINQFANKYYYMQGITYMAMVNFSF